MRVIFKTNIDAYKTNCFPENFTIPPRIGEKVYVAEVFKSYYEQKNLPGRLEVVDVSWFDYGVICELGYNETDKKAYTQSGHKLF